MTIQDKEAGEALVRSIEKIRATTKHGKIEVVIENGKATCIRIVKVVESELLQTK